ncbi:MAG TPA: S4 domain-containing protein [Steroidobacteraceae bacterium]|nr:S4 domain-containing protein [Steroidobacteraceae bacterium]
MRAPRAEPERLQKVLARAGLASRREAETWIRAGRLTVNGQAATLGVRVAPDDEVRLDGRLIRQRAPGSGGRVYLYHRSPGESLDSPPGYSPAGERVAEGRPPGKALLERLPKRAGRRFMVVSPMPRIDGGLELVCGDGELAARLQRSVHALSSELSVRVRGELSEQQLAGVLGGVLDSGERLSVQSCEPAGGEGANRWYAVTAQGASGKDIRQLFERQGAIVSRVLRTRLGSLVLERSLARGQFRELAREELAALLQASSEGKPPQGSGALPQMQPSGRRSPRGSPRPPVHRRRARD